MRPFLQRDAFAVEVAEIVDDDEWIVDGEIKVRALLSKAAAKKQRTGQALQYEWESRILSKMFPSSGRQEAVFLREDATANDIPADTPSDEPSEQTNSIAGFLISGPRKPGKFDVEAAKKLGIPAGPLFGRLQKGEPVNWDGRVIEPEECVAAASSAPVILYLHKSFATYSSKSIVEAFLEPEQTLVGVIHDYTDPKPIEGCLNMAYAQGDKSLEPVLVGSLLQSIELNSTDPSIYCVPLSRKSEYHDSRFEPIRPLCKLHLVPKVELEQRPIVLPEHIGANLYTARSMSPSSNDGMVTFLGTGACIPGKYRNGKIP